MSMRLLRLALIAALVLVFAPAAHATQTCSERAWECGGFLAPGATVTRVMVTRSDFEFSGKSNCSETTPELEKRGMSAERMNSKGASDVGPEPYDSLRAEIQVPLSSSKA